MNIERLKKRKIRRNTDPTKKKYMYTGILECIYNTESKENTKIPNIKDIVDMCELNNITVLQKDITEALRLYVNLGILRISGNNKYYSKTYEEGDIILRKTF